jgi:hypothetical protein
MALDQAPQNYTPNFLMAPPVAVLSDGEKSIVTRSGDVNYIPDPSSGLARGLFDAGDGLTLSYYYSTQTSLDNAAVASVGISGFKSDLILNPREIGFATKRNIPLAWLAIHNPERSLGFMEANKRAYDKFLRDPPAPVREIIESRVPTVLSAHSTGAQISVVRANNPEHYRWLSDNFCGAVYQSTMLATTPLLNRGLSPERQKQLLNWCASRYPHKIPEEFRLGQAYLWLSGYRHTIDPDRVFIRPAMGQVTEICKTAQKEILDKQGPHIFAKGDLPIAAFMGGDDRSAYPEAQKAFFASVGAGIFLDETAGHAPICQNKRNMVGFIRTLHEMANGTFDPSAHKLPEAAPSRASRAASTIYNALPAHPTIPKPRMPSLFSRTL